MNFQQILFFISIIFLFSCQQEKPHMALYPSESSQERVDWEIQRLADPITGKIPNNIR